MTIKKSRLIPLRCWFSVVMLLLPSVCQSQDFKKNIVYAELAGPGIFYSINYERIITPHFTSRFGASLMPRLSNGGKGHGFYILPIMANYIEGEGSNKVEVGAGVDVIVDNSDSEALFIGTLGYRYQPSAGGFHFRIVASPIFSPKTAFVYFPLIGLSFGTCF